MKIRTRLSFQFTVIVGTILCLFTVAIYYFSADFRKKDYFERLKERALTTGRFLLKVKEIDSKLLRIIDRTTAQALVEEKIFVFDHTNRLIYSNVDDLPENINEALLRTIRDKREYRYSDGERETIGLIYKFHGNKFVIIASAWDKYGLGKLRNLKIVLTAGLILCIAATLFAGWFYSNQALRPISNVIKKVDEITENKLNLRVDEGNRKDEIALLAITFNNMLDRLENAFFIQKSFVSNASHEMRTPLTSIAGQIEVALLKERDKTEYEEILRSALEDIQSLNKLTNGLLDLTVASSDISVLHLDNVRMDEVLFQARSELLKRYNSYTIHISLLDLPDDEEKITAFGNERLLGIAFMNLMDNACKYSQDCRGIVEFSSSDGKIRITVSDKGTGISQNDLRNIFQPFFRSAEARNKPGHGLGLSLAERIIHLHKGTITVQSQINSGTSFTVILPSISSPFN
ncbi:MAG: HAMP domain-containing histidine kinase [Bacteroidetes bacterium]|nr:HAMP domain-containing histidine kinase [Bacteroidota bacterium]